MQNSRLRVRFRCRVCLGRLPGHDDNEASFCRYCKHSTWLYMLETRPAVRPGSYGRQHLPHHNDAIYLLSGTSCRHNSGQSPSTRHSATHTLIPLSIDTSWFSVYRQFGIVFGHFFVILFILAKPFKRETVSSSSVISFRLSFYLSPRACVRACVRACLRTEFLQSVSYLLRSV